MPLLLNENEKQKVNTIEKLGRPKCLHAALNKDRKIDKACFI